MADNYSHYITTNYLQQCCIVYERKDEEDQKRRNCHWLHKDNDVLWMRCYSGGILITPLCLSSSGRASNGRFLRVSSYLWSPHPAPLLGYPVIYVLFAGGGEIVS